MFKNNTQLIRLWFEWAWYIIDCWTKVQTEINKSIYYRGPRKVPDKKEKVAY